MKDEFSSEQKIEGRNTDLLINTWSVRTLCSKIDIRIGFVKKYSLDETGRGGGGKIPGPDYVASIFVFLGIICRLLSLGPGSSVGVATDYRLDGRGSNPGGDEIFRPSRPALGPT